MAVKKFRRICGITYLCSTDLLKIIEEKKNVIRNYAFIIHNNDIYTEDIPSRDIVAGQLKETHIHFILLFKYPYPLSTIQNWFKGWFDDKDEVINTLKLESVSNLNSAFRYLTHIDCPDKYQYNENEIFSLDINEFKKDDVSCEDSSLMALDMLLMGCSYYDIAVRFGRDFIFHFPSIRELAEEILRQQYIEDVKINKSLCDKNFKDKKEKEKCLNC